jgi:hypothetical protein
VWGPLTALRNLHHVTEAVTDPLIRPMPTDDEAAAIAAALDALWPRPMPVEAAGRERRTSWRFSGRWWSVPTPVRRDRPYL